MTITSERGDYLLRLKIHNGRIASVMRERGISSIAGLSLASGIHKMSLYHLFNMKTPAIGKRGKWRVDAVRLADFFGVLPEELFNERQQTTGLAKTSGEATISERQALEIHRRLTAPLLESETSIDRLENELDEITAKAIIWDAVAELPHKRDQEVLRLRYCDGKEYAEIGEILAISVPRVRQIEARALRMLRQRTTNNKRERLHTLDDAVKRRRYITA